jgi:hypothetical protein
MSNVTADPTTTLQAFQWLQLLGLGGMAGALGQGARTIIGLKKLSDAANSANVPTGDLVAVHKLVISLAIGFVAGALASIGIIENPRVVTAQQIFALAAAGYAGADFIEGLISRVSGTTQAKPGQEAVGVGVVPASAAGPSSDDAVG